LGNLTAAYNGSAHAVTVTTTPAGLPVSLTYGGSATAPTNPGTYSVVGTINDPNYTGSASGTLTITQGSATVTLGNLTAVYNGAAHAATATTTPAGLAVTFTYSGSATAPTNPGSYNVVGTINDPNYTGSATGTLSITPAGATVTLSNLTATYNGSPHPVTATTTPAGLPVSLTYSGNPTAPSAVGTYNVVGTINNPDYVGSATGTLTINAAAPPTPKAPSQLVVVPTSASEVNLSWQDNSAIETGYNVLRSTTPSGAFTQVGSVVANVTTYHDSGLTPEATYYYQVVAVGSAGNSKPSNTAAASMYAPYNPPGLLGYWNFDEGVGTTAHDVTENGYNGTLNGGVAFNLPGVIGSSALGFDGTGNVVVSDAPALHFAANQSFTLSAWVQEKSASAIDQGVICKSRDNGNYYGIWIRGSDNRWVFRGPAGDVVGPIATSNWTHVTVVQDGVAKTRSLYVNGVLAAGVNGAPATGPAQAADGTGDLWFGQANSVNQPFNGNLDEVRLYGRALAASEITNLMAPPIWQAESIQNQGTAGTIGFALPIDGSIFIEPRQGATPGTYQLSLSFSTPVSGITASLGLQPGQSGAAVGKLGTIGYDSTGKIVTIPLSAVGNAQKLQLHLSGILPGNGTADIAFNVLVGDVDGNGIVNQADANLVSAAFSGALTDENAVDDINCDGQVNAADVAIITANLAANPGQSLGGLQPNWSDRDIGGVNQVGTATVTNGVYTVQGAGTSMGEEGASNGPGGLTDSFHYAYQSLTGDGTIIARLTGQSGADNTGVMIRQDLTPGSPFVQLTRLPVVTATLEYRAVAGANSIAAGSVTSVYRPLWFKLSRAGQVFTGYSSADGVTWNQIGTPVTVAMSSTVTVGLVECAQDNDQLKSGVFDHVSVTVP
jgi:hypothetical protein